MDPPPPREKETRGGEKRREARDERLRERRAATTRGETCDREQHGDERCEAAAARDEWHAARESRAQNESESERRERREPCAQMMSARCALYIGGTGAILL